MSVEKRIAWLSQEIRAADALYYQDDNPALSDAEYDALRKELIALEAEHPHLILKNSPTQSVGAKPSGKFGKIKHTVPMLSLDNAFSDEDVSDFVARVKRFLSLADDAPLAFTAEPKIDGLSAALRYENGCDRQFVYIGNGAKDAGRFRLAAGFGNSRRGLYRSR